MARGRGSGAEALCGAAQPMVAVSRPSCSSTIIRLVRDLFGDYDANLAVIEERLGIEARGNGNAVSLRGPKPSCATRAVGAGAALRAGSRKAR